MVEGGVAPWRCADAGDLRQRFNGLDALYRQIKTGGYKKQTELRRLKYDIKIIDEISVNIDRNGNLLFNNGAHRLAIAKILALESVPVRITVCHARCKNFKKLQMVGKGQC